MSHAGITHISIRDFRGIDSLEVSFKGPSGYPTQIAVLAGPNGSGKTAVLEACLLAAKHEELVRGKSGKEAIRRGADDYQIDVTIQLQNDIRQVHATSKGRGQAFVPLVYFSSWRAPQLVGSLGITAGKRGKRPAKTEENRLWNIKQFLVNARAHEFFPKRQQTDGSRYEMAIHDLNHVWGKFYPGQSFTVEPISDDPHEGFDVFLLGPHGFRLPLDLLSSGQLELFSFAGALLLEEFSQGIILIDEPELHLDPQWHRTVVRTFQYLKPDCQVVVATHSPDVYDSVRSFERHFLVPADDPRAKAWSLQAAVKEDEE
jgi:energy-coupling factor transporter ATP-binding protein EcfA2